jgi:hypothetical protein
MFKVCARLCSLCLRVVSVVCREPACRRQIIIIHVTSEKKKERRPPTASAMPSRTWRLVMLLAQAAEALPRVRVPGLHHRWVRPEPRAVVPTADTGAHSLLTSVGWGVTILSSWMVSAPASGGAAPNDASASFSSGSRLDARDGVGQPLPVNILCLDGGGILGRNHMAIVEELEAATGTPACRSFDLVAGTSIGGCGALFLSKYGPNATALAREAMRELQHRCFADRSFRRLLRRGHLCADGRRRFIHDICGDDEDTTMRDGPPGFALAARRCPDSGLRPFLFRSYPPPVPAISGGGSAVLDGTSTARLWEAVDATSAAPFMFPDARLGADGGGNGSSGGSAQAGSGGEGSADLSADVGELGGIKGCGDEADGGEGGIDHVRTMSGNASLTPDAPTPLPPPVASPPSFLRLIDGGVVANDPTLLAIAEARLLYPDRPIGTVVSLSTGLPSGNRHRRQRAREARHVRRTRAALRILAPGASYFRLVPRLLTPVSPIAHDEGALAAMEQATREGLRASPRGRQLIEQLRRRSQTGREGEDGRGGGSDGGRQGRDGAAAAARAVGAVRVAEAEAALEAA